MRSDSGKKKKNHEEPSLTYLVRINYVSCSITKFKSSSAVYIFIHRYTKTHTNINTKFRKSLMIIQRNSNLTNAINIHCFLIVVFAPEPIHNHNAHSSQVHTNDCIITFYAHSKHNHCERPKQTAFKKETAKSDICGHNHKISKLSAGT